MRLSHFVITRFNLRLNDAFKHIRGPVLRTPVDPLDPNWLEVRFKLFEITCLPSVLGQLEQNFAWIILVDRGLADSDRDRLLALTRSRKRTFIHAFDPPSDLGSLDWLARYRVDPAEYVITTNLDNDDVLPARFTAATQARVREAYDSHSLPPLAFMGARQIVQWDLLTSSEAPLGWKAAWHRAVRTADGATEPTTASAGVSLLCKSPPFNFCVLAIRHAGVGRYLDFSVPPPNRTAAKFRDAVARVCKANDLDLMGLHRNDLYYDLSQDLGPVLMTNHLWNGESGRVFESKPERTVVTGAREFPDALIDWDKARLYADCFNAPEAVPPA
jgi:hypothetical protein